MPTADRWFGRFAVVCAVATVVLLLGAVVAAPDALRPGLLAITGFTGAAAVLATWLLSRGVSQLLLTVAGFMLMSMGIAAGALLPDGLDGVVILPLAGAVITVPAQRGRPLVAVFVLAFVASMAGEFAAHTTGGLAGRTDLDVPLSLLGSAVMLAFTYGLVWWVGDRWRRANAEATRALANQRHLLEVNERLLSSLDPEGVLNLIADSLASVVVYDHLTIYRVDRDASLLRPLLARDRHAPLIMDAVFPLDRGITGWAVAHGEAQCVNDAHRDPRTVVIPGTTAEAESLIVVPLFVDGVVTGTLNLGRTGEAEAHFAPEEFELARLFAAQASIALQNAETHRAVATRAETDALTGLLNRGAFDARLATLAVDARARPLGLLMLDLDGFKAYNDRLGHPAGDGLLQAIGPAIMATLRGADLCFRYGGDEMAILLPHTDQKAAMHVAERVRLAVGAVDGAQSGVTASIGLAEMPLDAATGDGLLSAADIALYRAKQAGGDRVVSTGTPAGDVSAAQPVRGERSPRTAAL